MSAHAARWLYAPTGRLRAAWRLALFACAVIAAGMLVLGVVYPALVSLASAAGVSLNAWLAFPLADWLTFGALLLAHLAMLAWIERRPWADVGLGRDALRPRALALGWALGALAIALPTLAMVGTHALRVQDGARGSWAANALVVLARLAPPAMNEELLFRGYGFLVLREALGPAAALVVTSVAFGLVHLQNPGANPLAIAMVIVAGFFLGGVRLATGSLWAAIAAHLAWNWTLAGVLHTAVSGWPLPMPSYRLVDGGPDWLTGGAWGPEGGLPAGVGMLAAMALLARRGRLDLSQRGPSAAGAHSDG